MSKKKRAQRASLMYAFKVVDTFHWDEEELAYESPWFDTEDLMDAARLEYKKKVNFDPKGFYQIEIITQPKK